MALVEAHTTLRAWLWTARCRWEECRAGYIGRLGFPLHGDFSRRELGNIDELTGPSYVR